MTEPRTMAEETLAMLEKMRDSSRRGVLFRHEVPLWEHAAACVRFVAAIDSGEMEVGLVHLNAPNRVAIILKDADVPVLAPTALEAFAKARDAQ